MIRPQEEDDKAIVCFTPAPWEKGIIYDSGAVLSSHPNKEQSNEASLDAVTPMLLHKKLCYHFASFPKTLACHESINPYSISTDYSFPDQINTCSL